VRVCVVSLFLGTKVKGQRSKVKGQRSQGCACVCVVSLFLGTKVCVCVLSLCS